VLRLGEMVGQGPASDFDSQRVVELMTTGRYSGDRNGRAPAAGKDG
jgi:ABC-type sugar transport system ATPase subunit